MSKQTLAHQRRTINAGISLDRDIIKKLDEMIGDVPRSKFIQRLIEKAEREEYRVIINQKQEEIEK